MLLSPLRRCSLCVYVPVLTRTHTKQLGLAMHNYHSAINCFPPGATRTTNFSGAVGAAGSAHSMHIEQTHHFTDAS